MTVIKKTFVVSALLFSAAGYAQDNKVLNLYSSRHYQTDEALYSNFTRPLQSKPVTGELPP